MSLTLGRLKSTSDAFDINTVSLPLHPISTLVTASVCLYPTGVKPFRGRTYLYQCNFSHLPLSRSTSAVKSHRCLTLSIWINLHRYTSVLFSHNFPTLLKFFHKFKLFHINNKTFDILHSLNYFDSRSDCSVHCYHSWVASNVSLNSCRNDSHLSLSFYLFLSIQSDVPCGDWISIHFLSRINLLSQL